MFVTFTDTYIIVSPSYIQFGVDVCIAQITYEIRDEGKQVLVAYGESIDLSVILYWS